MKIHIKNGRLIDPKNGIDAVRDLYIAAGRIVGNGSAPDGFSANHTLDATGLIVSPGLVDLSARLREPGFEYKATLESELLAAAAGGVTSLACPPDTDPVLDEPGLVEMLKHRAKQLNLAHVYPLGALTRQLEGRNLTEMCELTEAGCVGFSQADAPLAPSVRKISAESGIDAATVPGSGKDGRVTKGDMLAAIEKAASAPTPVNQPAAAVQVRAPSPADDAAREERVKMTRLRQTIARRLKDVQNTAAMLTTFNEVDMSHIMAMRAQYKDVFEKKHGSKLGFMGFFTKACVQALKDIPAANAEIDGTDLIYKNYYHIGVAVGTDKGLVVPVVRDSDRKSIAEIEKSIADFGRRARDGQLKIDEMQGGTFTITNGGIYGSLMSTPILNAPQSAILGMHKIQDRPVAIAGKVEIRPMMYLALSYDHRVIDGKEAVTFLVRVKESLEDPARLVLDL